MSKHLEKTKAKTKSKTDVSFLTRCKEGKIDPFVCQVTPIILYMALNSHRMSMLQVWQHFCWTMSKLPFLQKISLLCWLRVTTLLHHTGRLYLQVLLIVAHSNRQWSMRMLGRLLLPSQVFHQLVFAVNTIIDNLFCFLQFFQSSKRRRWLSAICLWSLWQYQGTSVMGWARCLFTRPGSTAHPTPSPPATASLWTHKRWSAASKCGLESTAGRV